jgi:hypothetical protein
MRQFLILRGLTDTTFIAARKDRGPIPFWVWLYFYIEQGWNTELPDNAIKPCGCMGGGGRRYRALNIVAHWGFLKAD